ncbi:predicted protein [Nematostella vectensis]|uniref:Uncharacterized protein n=1 Tax=Nematostella vectensis TaxID=45351 RepID=A7S7I9_NEMVE|nr:predicted protein [Nematostella vectensis]|eukprot:XP_001632401.1 predicted protein [Nematostella vectensis]
MWSTHASIPPIPKQALTGIPQPTTPMQGRPLQVTYLQCTPFQATPIGKPLQAAPPQGTPSIAKSIQEENWNYPFMLFSRLNSHSNDIFSWCRQPKYIPYVPNFTKAETTMMGTVHRQVPSDSTIHVNSEFISQAQGPPNVCLNPNPWHPVRVLSPSHPTLNDMPYSEAKSSKECIPMKCACADCMQEVLSPGGFSLPDLEEDDTGSATTCADAGVKEEGSG